LKKRNRNCNGTTLPTATRAGCRETSEPIRACS
jgi:hypothetical protein